MKRVRSFLRGKQNLRIVDLGCGEGSLVEEFRAQGYNMTGVDFNYQSDSVKMGSILDVPHESNSVDIVLCLDVIEHLSLMDQEKAISEIHRILKPGGVFYATIPNLAHLASRLSFLVRGKLIRTSEIERHPGDRPFGEYVKLLKKQFVLEKTFGIFPTFPIISFLTYFIPSKVVWLHSIYNVLLPIKGWCFLNHFICRKPTS